MSIRISRNRSHMSGEERGKEKRVCTGREPRTLKSQNNKMLLRKGRFLEILVWLTACIYGLIRHACVARYNGNNKPIREDGMQNCRWQMHIARPKAAAMFGPALPGNIGCGNRWQHDPNKCAIDRSR